MPHIKFRTAIGLIAIILLIGAACGKKATNTSNTTNTTTTNVTTTTDAVESNAVEMINTAFNPATIKVRKGTTVTWTNNDSLVHTVTGTDSGPRSDLLNPGDKYTFTFDQVGTFAYNCTPHPFMKGTVQVTE